METSVPLSPRHLIPHCLQKLQLEPTSATIITPVATFGLEHKRQRLQQHGFDDNALDVFLDPALRPSTENYSHIQNRFINWCIQHDLDYKIPNPAQIINFIAYGHQSLKWQPSTCNTYRSSILDLYPDHRAQIISDHDFHQFFTLLTSSQIHSLNRPAFDISPVVTITGVLRPSDIQSIDDSPTLLNPDRIILTLVIDCPKEKRQGQRIQRQVHIRHHPDLRLCPIQVYSSYKSRVASTPLMIAYSTQPQCQIHSLIRHIFHHIFHHNRPIVSQTIRKHINHLIDLIALSHGTLRPCAAALDFTAAAVYGFPIGNILTHGFLGFFICLWHILPPFTIYGF
ncbi:unnamed protein product [Rhizopus stolonifer]